MSEPADWLPPLIAWNDFNNDLSLYVEAVYSVFKRDMLDSVPLLSDSPVRCRRDPIRDGKEAGFWHCTTEGKVEENRDPDMSRCARIGWLRTVIEHVDDSRVDRWTTDKRGDDRHYLWFDEEYLIVLGVRKSSFQLITAFVTSQEHNKRKLRKERDESHKN
jgi:hypothetical protein